MLKLIFLIALFTSPGTSISKVTEKDALKTIKSLGKTLKKNLKKKLKTGKIEALNFCHLNAKELTKKEQTKNIQVGRVSLKNRNPQNAIKEWMKPAVQQYHQSKTDKPYTVVTIDKETKGIIKPIYTAPLCLQCHGSNITRELQNEIKKRYPNDKATGYKAGDIRGFFWATYTNQP